MVVISQIWVQHLNCTQIIGHCHLRTGSELDPFLGGSMFTALVATLADIEHEFKYTMSGFYGYRIPEIEGIGLFTVSNKNFRIFFLCEGLYRKGIPYLAGKELSQQINRLFSHLQDKSYADSCTYAHRLEEGSYWFDLMCSVGFGGEISVGLIDEIYPLRSVTIHTKSHLQTSNTKIFRLESSLLGSLGYGWKDRDDMIASKIEGIFREPERSYHFYEAIFKQVREFIPNFEPNTVILTYQPSSGSESQSALVAFLSVKGDSLDIRYCIPIVKSSGMHGTPTNLYLQSLFLDS
ncbi:MAG: hypothetical protein ACW97Z_05580 [Candidatus Hodarchaeales archaeon]